MACARCLPDNGWSSMDPLLRYPGVLCILRIKDYIYFQTKPVSRAYLRILVTCPRLKCIFRRLKDGVGRVFSACC